MKSRRENAAKILTVAGTAAVWFPIAATLLTAIVGSIMDRTLRFDYLMPAELFFVALAGAVLLLCAALLKRTYQWHIGLGTVAMALFLAAVQIIAVRSGLAHGTAAPAGIYWTLVIVSLALYCAALLWLCVVAVLLDKKIFRRSEAVPSPDAPAQ